jgi:Flp pilus assembly pilin Flp
MALLGHCAIPGRTIESCQVGSAGCVLGHNPQQDLIRMRRTLRQFWLWEKGQDLAEYAVMIAVILVIVIGTVKLISTNKKKTPLTQGSSLRR